MTSVNESDMGLADKQHHFLTLFSFFPIGNDHDQKQVVDSSIPFSNTNDF